MVKGWIKVQVKTQVKSQFKTQVKALVRAQAKNVLLASFLVLISSASQAAGLRTNCRVDQFNPIANQCVCDVKSSHSNSSNVSGFAVFNCNSLACEEFSSTERPNECVPGMRGVSCLVSQVEYTCSLSFPRVAPSLDAKTLCWSAVNDINSRGPNSGYYRFLSYPSCVPFGYSQPPFSGWMFKGQFVEGWN